MKNFLSRHLAGIYSLLVFSLVAMSSIAGENSSQEISAGNTSATSTFSFSGEFTVEETYVGNGDVQHGAHVLSDFAKDERPWVEALCGIIADNAELLAKGQVLQGDFSHATG